jgi:TP901 family phage tail tape measure protein
MAANAGSVRAELILANGDWKRKVAGAKEDMRGMGRQAQRTGKDIKAIQKASAAVATGVAVSIAAATATAANFEAALSKLEAISGATSEEMDTLETRIRDLAETSVYSASQTADAARMLAMAGLDTKEIYEALPAVLNLAATSNMSMAQSADIATNIMSGMGLEAKDLTSVMDVLAKTATSSNTNVSELGQGFKMVAPLANTLGVSVEETASMMGILANNGIKGSQAGTALRSVFSQLINPIGQAKDAVDELNLELRDQEGNLKSMPEVLDEFRKKTSDLTESQQAQYASMLVGREGVSAFLGLMNSGEGTIEDFTAKLENSDGAAKDMADTMQDNLFGAFKEFQSAMEELGISVGQEFLPVFTEIVEKATDLVGVLGDLNPDIVTTGLKMTGAAAGVALVASTVVRLAGKIRLLYAAMGPTGWVILGLSAIAGVAVGAADGMRRANEVSLDSANAMTKQADQLDKNIERYEALRDKSKLTTDELARFVDINSEIRETADPETIKRLKDEQEKLRKKSGLTNDQLDEFLGLNDKIIETVPKSDQVITDKGNALLSTTDAAKEYNAEQREMIRLELEAQLAKAEANRAENLRKEKNLVAEIKDIEKERDSIAKQITDQKSLIAVKEAKINDLLAKGDDRSKATAMNIERQVRAEKRKLQQLRDQLAEQAQILLDKKEELGLTRDELKKLDEINQKMVDLELSQVGLNAKKGEGIRKVDEEIRKLTKQRQKISDNIQEQEHMTEEQRETISKIEGQIDELNTVKARINDINGEAGNLNATLGRDITKNIRVDYDYTRTPVKAFGKYGNMGTRHQGGTFDRSPEKFHAGGSPALRFNPPQHNEVDVRLLRNEMVLTEAQQASLFRQLDTAGASQQAGADFTETNALLAEMNEAIRNSGGDVVLYVGEREFGRVAEPIISREQKRSIDVTKRRRGG